MLLARTKDGKYVQMTDSAMIVSLLSSYTIDPTVPIEDLVKYYPSISYFKDDGNKVNDILNKYHLIYGEKTPKNLSNEDLMWVGMFWMKSFIWWLKSKIILIL